MYRPLNGRRRGSTLAGLELARQPLDATHQDGEVGSDGGEQRAELHAAPRKGEVVGQHPRRLARGSYAGDGSLHRRDDFGVEQLSRVAEAGGKVAGADEDAVDAVDRGDLLDGVERLARP